MLFNDCNIRHIIAQCLLEMMRLLQRTMGENVIVRDTINKICTKQEYKFKKCNFYFDLGGKFCQANAIKKNVGLPKYKVMFLMIGFTHNTF